MVRVWFTLVYIHVTLAFSEKLRVVDKLTSNPYILKKWLRRNLDALIRD